jgi:hypothetical protein
MNMFLKSTTACYANLLCMDKGNPCPFNDGKANGELCSWAQRGLRFKGESPARPFYHFSGDPQTKAGAACSPGGIKNSSQCFRS